MENGELPAIEQKSELEPILTVWADGEWVVAGPALSEAGSQNQSVPIALQIPVRQIVDEANAYIEQAELDQLLDILNADLGLGPENMG